MLWADDMGTKLILQLNVLLDWGLGTFPKVERRCLNHISRARMIDPWTKWQAKARHIYELTAKSQRHAYFAAPVHLWALELRHIWIMDMGLQAWLVWDCPDGGNISINGWRPACSKQYHVVIGVTRDHRCEYMRWILDWVSEIALFIHIFDSWRDCCTEILERLFCHQVLSIEVYPST